MGQGMLHRLIAVLMDVAGRLGAECACTDYEKVAILVHRIMSFQSRQFHTLEHVFGFLEVGPDGKQVDPETALAAVFHDLVYYQVDDGLPPDLVTLLESYLRRDENVLFIAEDAGLGGGGSEDRGLDICLAVFGFERGARLDPFRGLNEFLSALAMVRLLGSHLPAKTIVAVVACIEASIPFRKPDRTGKGAAELLAERLARVTARRIVALEAEELETIVHRAVAFGNADVRDFCLDDASLFLSNTWRLLPESNSSLRHGGAFSIREYRVALQKMRGFFTGLDPAAIYHSYKGIPSQEDMKAREEGARRNVILGALYLKAKLLAVAFLEAAADVSGGDAPMALFMGDIPSGGGTMETLASHLPETHAPSWIDEGNAMYRLLRDGRLGSTSFDLRNSPLALYFYSRLEPRAWMERSEAADLFFSEAGPQASPEADKEKAASRFLEGFSRPLREELFAACAIMVPTRRERFEAWLASH